MCYSAQIWQDYRRYVRTFGAKMDIKEFVEIFWRRRTDPSIKIPKGMEDAFMDPATDEEQQIKTWILEHRANQSAKLEQELFAQVKRLADADRKLQDKETKAALDSKRIATSRIAQIKGRLDDLKRTEPLERDDRIFPGVYAPVMVLEGGKRVVKPMRYQCRPAGNSRLPARNMSEFIALLKANPGRYSFASSGIGSIAHMDGEQFKSVTGTDMVHVPYRGSGPAINDTVAGLVAAQFDNLSSSLSFIQSGMLRALAVASPERVPELPDVPTYAEVGLKPLNNVAWFGLTAPAGMQPEVVRKLNSVVNQALSDPKVVARLKQNEALAQPGSPAEFADRIAAELALRKGIAARQHIVLD